MHYLVTNVRIEEETLKELKHRAVEERRRVAELIREAIREYLRKAREKVVVRGKKKDPLFSVIGMCKTRFKEDSERLDELLSEIITRLRYRAGFRYAKEFGEKYRHSTIIKTIWIDPDLEKEAWQIFLKYSDKDLSYVDYFSFACMQAKEIDQALTFDKHFRQVGFSMLPAGQKEGNPG